MWCEKRGVVISVSGFKIWKGEKTKRLPYTVRMYGTHGIFLDFFHPSGYDTCVEDLQLRLPCKWLVLPWIRTWRSRKSQFAGWVVIVMLCDICTLSRAGFFRSGRMADWSREACWISNSIFPEYHCKLISSRWCGDGRKIMIVAPAPIITKIWRRGYQLHYQLHCP